MITALERYEASAGNQPCERTALFKRHYGVITGVGLTYLTIETDEGPLNVPNSAILSAANMGAKSTPGAENAPHYGQVWAGMAGPLPLSASPYRLPEVTSAGR